MGGSSQDCSTRTETVQIERCQESNAGQNGVENQNGDNNSNCAEQENSAEKQNGGENQTGNEKQNGSAEQNQGIQSRDLVLRDIHVVLLGGRAEYV